MHWTQGSTVHCCIVCTDREPTVVATGTDLGLYAEDIRERRSISATPVEELKLEGACIWEFRSHGVHQLRVCRDAGQLHQLRLAAERALRLRRSRRASVLQYHRDVADVAISRTSGFRSDHCQAHFCVPCQATTCWTINQVKPAHPILCLAVISHSQV